MKLKIKKSSTAKLKARLKNKIKIRKKISGTAEIPRFAVFKSGKHLYAQLIDDSTGNTLASSSTLKKGKSGTYTSRDNAAELGKAIAAEAQKKKIESVVFDRSGYLYHGKIKSLADGAREAGLKF